MRKLVIVVALLGSLSIVPSAHATINDVFGVVPCSNFDNGTPGNPSDDQRRCGVPGTNEVQTLTVDATGGTFTLTFDGDTTAPIAENASAAAVDAELEGLSSLGIGDVDVQGAAGGPYTITFRGALAKTNVAEITTDASGLTGGAGTAVIATTTQGEAPSTAPTFDGMPIDVNMAFPPDPGVGDGNFPLLIVGHGYGGSKFNFSQMKRFTDRGYAVFSMTDRGFHESCGTPASKAKAGAACDDGYIRLMDTRYEVRDAQEFAGELAEEDVVDPQRIGAVGGSYGGGLAMALAALKTRKMLPDGSLIEWRSGGPDNEAMRLAGAVPNIPWTDLAYSLVPNGGTLDYVTDAPYTGRFGVMKQSLVNGLYISGITSGEGFYAPTGTDPGADLTGWKARLDAGEPYDGDPAATAILDEIKSHHSSYYIDDSLSPAPMLISSGFTDDLFPAEEAIRFYNKTRSKHPGTPINLFFGDFGHQRAANKADVVNALIARENAWLDFYVKGTGSAPASGVETWTQTCPNSAGTASGGPFTAANWAMIARGEVRHSDAAAKTISPGAGDTAIAPTFDPVNSGQNPCRTATGADQAGIANYRLPAAPSSGYTLMGAASVIADFTTPADSQVAARLLDVDPSSGQETLVARGLWRPTVGSGRQVFQLHPNGWKFAAGHVPKLELLSRDASDTPLSSYGRASNGQGPVTVSNLELRLPVLEPPGTGASTVKAATAAKKKKGKKKKGKKKKKRRVTVAVKVPRDKVVPSGFQLTPDFAALGNDANAVVGKGKLAGSGSQIKVRIAAPSTWVSCHAEVQILGAGAGASGKKGKSPVLAKGRATVAGGKTGVAKLRLTKAGRVKLRGRAKAKVRVKVVTAEQDGVVVAKRTVRFK